MNDKTQASGKCLCGAVTLNASAMRKQVGACHCSVCRKWAGGPMFAVDCDTGVSFNDEANVTVYHSSEWADRGFCKACGTHLFYRIKASGQYIVPAGLFDNVDGLVFDHQIFIEEKPDYYCFANETTNMTGEEVFAQFPAADQ